MAVITISRQFGAGGRTMGHNLAQRLGYSYTDETMIKKLAERAQVSPEGLGYFEKSGGSGLHRFMERMVSNSYLDRILGGRYKTLDAETYLRVVSDYILELYQRGDYVITGRGGQYVLRRKPDVVHVLLVGDYADRVEFVQVKFNLSARGAVALVRQADEERRNFLDLFGQKNHDEPNHYTLCINTSRVSMAVAEDLIVQCLDRQLATSPRVREPIDGPSHHDRLA